MHNESSALDLPCVCTTVRKAARALSRVYDDELAGTGISVIQLAVLRAIGRTGAEGAPLSRLADTLVMEPTSLYRTLAKLEGAGWVDIVAAGKGRTKVVTLTVNGRKTTDGAAAAWEAAQTKVAAAFGVARWDAIHPAIADLAAIGARLMS